MPFLPFYVAKQKGFDRANGLEIEFQTLAGTPSVQALVAGGLDFSTSAGSIVNARLNGAPVTVLMISIDKSAYTIFAGPEIRDVQALRGKTVAVNAVGGSQHSEAILGLSKAGVNVDDVRFVGLPGDALVAAFDSGAVDAGVVLTPQDLELEKLGKGFHKLLNLGDYAVGINGGLGTTTARLQAAPAIVDGMGAASLMGLRYVVENREGTLPLIQEYLQVDAPTAARIYDDNRQAYSDGKSTRETRREIVEHAAESLKLPPPAEEGDAFDFGPLDRAAHQLETSGWRAR
jgi:ABC-type nitrate/sulfonate/bicarbonate transport system substrate-binding protein